jgi:iron complex transport system permease protein
MKKPLLLFTLLTLLVVLLLLLGISSGGFNIPMQQLAEILRHPEQYPIESQIIFELRLPRVVAAFIVGALLALAGAVMQTLLTNPLADPYILGISGGSATGALLTLLLGLSGIWLTIGAFGGAILTIFIVFSLTFGGRDHSNNRLLLTGVVISAGWGAVISLILSIAPNADLRGMLFWLMGDLSGARDFGVGGAVLLLGAVVLIPKARALNLLTRGDLAARALGVETGPLRLQLYFVTSLLTATAVTIGGSIGFIGLITPHILRLVIGSDHRLLLPASILLGGAILVMADTISRTIIAPQQLPVGVITAIIGVPLFLYLLRREGGR